MSAVDIITRGTSDHINNASDQIHRPLRRWLLRHRYSARALLLHRDSAANRIDDARAADAASRAADKKGVGYWVIVGFDMNIVDFLVTLNVTVSRMINWRNTAS